MEGRLAELEEDVTKHKEYQRSSEQREQKLLHKIQSLEDELLTAGVYKDGTSQDKQQVRCFSSVTWEMEIITVLWNNWRILVLQKVLVWGRESKKACMFVIYLYIL